ncbi:hypothetical protein C0J52_01796, partial [Blattella germanica]
IWDEERIPKEWEYNIIIPIYKTVETTKCDNYRAICLSSVVLKIYTRILERKLREEVEEDLEEEQGAFRPGRQTQDAISTLRMMGEKLLEKNKKVLLAFIDLKSAFDLVPRAEIWTTLKEKGIGNKLIRVIRSTYHSTKGIVRIDGMKSEEFEMRNGVKQGEQRN